LTVWYLRGTSHARRKSARQLRNGLLPSGRVIPCVSCENPIRAGTAGPFDFAYLPVSTMTPRAGVQIPM
jgi:hypothetical protein